MKITGISCDLQDFVDRIEARTSVRKLNVGEDKPRAGARSQRALLPHVSERLLLRHGPIVRQVSVYPGRRKVHLR